MTFIPQTFIFQYFFKMNAIRANRVMQVSTMLKLIKKKFQNQFPDRSESITAIVLGTGNSRNESKCLGMFDCDKTFPKHNTI